MMGAMADVFLSYSLRDAHVAARLANELRLAGLNVLWDRGDIRIGAPIAESLRKHITESTAFVLLVPEDAAPSDPLRREIETALVRSATGDLLLLPVLLPGRKPAGNMARFRYIRVESEWDFSPVARVVSTAVRSKSVVPAQAEAESRVSFLSTLLRTDLARAPMAASLVLDEISQSVGSDKDAGFQQLHVLREALEWGRAQLGDHHPSVTLLMYRLADVLLELGDYAESADLSRYVLGTTANPKDTLAASFNLGNALVAMGRDSEAEQYYQAALDVARKFSTDSAAGTALVALGTIARRRGNRADAQALFEEAVHVTTSLAYPSARVNALIGLCEIFNETGDVGRGRPYAEEALWLARTALSGDHDLELRAAAAAGLAGTES